MSTDPGGAPPPPRTEPSRRLAFLLIPLAAVVLAAAVGVGMVARNAAADTIPGTAAPVLGPPPAHVQPDGSVRIGAPEAEQTVRVVMDLQCPFCKAFEEANGRVLEDAVRDGTVAVEYSVISFLDRASTTQYSSRAANASFCVADSGLDDYQAWLSQMYAEQPEEGGSGLPDSTLVEIAADNGYADPEVAACITERRYDTYLRAKTREVLDSGVEGTPTVYIDGAEISDAEALLSPDSLAPFLDAR